MIMNTNPLKKEKKREDQISIVTGNMNVMLIMNNKSRIKKTDERKN